MRRRRTRAREQGSATAMRTSRESCAQHRIAATALAGWRWASRPRRRALAPPRVRNVGRSSAACVSNRRSRRSAAKMSSCDGGPQRARRGHELAARGATHGVDVAGARRAPSPASSRPSRAAAPAAARMPRRAGREDRQEVVEGAHDRRRRRLTGQREDPSSHRARRDPSTGLGASRCRSVYCSTARTVAGLRSGIASRCR